MPRRRITICVLDRQPVLTHGVGHTLETAGYNCVSTPDVETIGAQGSSAAIVTCQSPGDDIRTAREHVDGDYPLIALLTDPTLTNYAAAIRANAAGIATVQDGPRELLRCVAAAMTGHLVLPRRVVQRLTVP